MPTPKLTGFVHVSPTPEDLLDIVAGDILNAALTAVGERGVFHLALSGGSTPEPLYVHLVIDPRYRNLPWAKTHIWIVDERRVPMTDAKSNARMIKETLVDHVPMKAKQFHVVQTEAENAAEIYEKELLAATGTPTGTTPRLDYVLLGMGDDAHTASLFPGSAALNEMEKLIVANDGPAVTPPPRITMTYRLINAARAVGVLVVGAKKSPTIQRVAAQLATGKPDIQKLPITGIALDDGDLTWYLDVAAAE